MEIKKEDIMKKLFSLLVAAVGLVSCTMITMQDIETHGTATDVVDDNQVATPTVNPSVMFPLLPGMK